MISELFLFKIVVTLFMLFILAAGCAAIMDTPGDNLLCYKLFKVSIIFFYVVSSALMVTLITMGMKAVWSL